MAESIKITEKELFEFNELKNQIQKKLFEFGELYLERIELDRVLKQLSERETFLRNEIEKIKQREIELRDNILKKYGEGNLNISDGTFTPT